MRLRRQVRVPLLLATGALAVGIGLLSYFSHALRTLELDTVDARFSIRGAQKFPKDLVVVGVDAKTLHALNLQWPYPRDVHARLVDRLHADRAKVIAFDVLFEDPENGPKRFCRFSQYVEAPGDCTFLSAIPRAGNLVLSESEVSTTGDIRFLGHDNVRKALESLGAHPGFAGIADDPNGTERRYLYGFSGLESFAVAIVERETGKPVPRSTFDNKGIAWIDYYGGPGTIPQVSYSDALQGKTPPGFFRGKTVLVGAVDPTIKDVFHTSTSGSQLMSGPELQANAVGTVRRGNPLRSVGEGWNIGLIVLLGLLTPAAAIPLRLRGLAIAAAAAIALPIGVQLAFDNGKIVAFADPLLALVIGFIAALVVQYFTETRERQRVRSLFARFVPENVVGEVLQRTDDDLRIGGVQREGTVMFSDLRGFTSFAESLPVERVIEVLNRYLGEMSEAILDSGGTLVAYMGDGIMAVFGAPIEQPDHADRGVAAAREMLGTRLRRFNEWLRSEGLSEGFRMGVGLNSGPVMSGNVGSERRLEYTAIGDTTNTASRIEGMTKGTPHQLFVSDTTRSLLRTPVPELFFVGEFEVRGREQKISLWSLPEDGAAPVAAGAAAAEAPAPAQEGESE
jgi:adenylate cyclase